jgi:predicted glycogen debranching enzyme
MLQIDFSPNDPDFIAKQIACEWLETNGLGGYASSNASGLNTRGYHGLLIASANPPGEQQLLVSRLDECLIPSSEWHSQTESDTHIQESDLPRYHLAVREFPNCYVPNGSQYLRSISKETHPIFIYEVDHPSIPIKNIRIKKEIICLHERQITIVKYSLISGCERLKIELRPFLAGRSIHARCEAKAGVFHIKNHSDEQFEVLQSESGLSTFISASEGLFKESPEWYYNFQLHEERLRGYDFVEDLFTPGTLEVELTRKHSAYVVLSFNESCQLPAPELFAEEIDRRKRLIKFKDPKVSALQKHLTLAADQFIVRRGNSKTIIAGYPWFSDWGRDALISLPGLCLSTRRFDDAREVLELFASNIQNGLIPNRFNDQNEPEYNSVDASLWFIIATHEFYRATKDLRFIRFHCLPAISEIMEAYYAGTDFDIGCDADGLLRAGTNQSQLTWMDARIDRMAVTPRNGKAVEINALWYNALKIAGGLQLRLAHLSSSRKYHKLAKLVSKNFREAFWNYEGGCLYDVIDQHNADGSIVDPSIRPNQIFALSLPFPLLEIEKAQRVLQVIENKLLTPFGLRTLSQDHPRYCGRYVGDVIDRDLAYHQGTTWLWLLGHYMRATYRYGGKGAATKIASLLKGIEPQLLQAGFGTLSEIYDAEAPHLPRGCTAQAWSVAEILAACSSRY